MCNKRILYTQNCICKRTSTWVNLLEEAFTVTATLPVVQIQRFRLPVRLFQLWPVSRRDDVTNRRGRTLPLEVHLTSTCPGTALLMSLYVSKCKYNNEAELCRVTPTIAEHTSLPSSRDGVSTMLISPYTLCWAGRHLYKKGEVADINDVSFRVRD